MYTPFFIEKYKSDVRLLVDPRVSRTRQHPLDLLIFIAMGTFLTGGASFYEMEFFAKIHRQNLAELFGMENPPSHDTFNRLFQAIRPECFNAFLAAFAQTLRFTVGAETPSAETPDILAFDGKTARRSASADLPALHTLNVWSDRHRLVIGQFAVEAKTNEITALPQLMRTLDLKGCVVTADALNTQKDTAAQAVSQGADYLLPLKGNHPLAESEVRAFLQDVAARTPPGFESVEKGHGRLETRRLWQSADISWFADTRQWPGLRSFALLRATREFPDGRKSEEERLYLSSLGMNPPLLAKAARSHWGVENACHWCLDVLFNEDQCRARVRNAAGNLSALRKHCMNLLRATPPPSFDKPTGLRARRYIASQNFDYLLLLINNSPRNPKI